MGSQDRRHKRKGFYCDALIDFGDGSPHLPCRVADISDGGARLIVGTIPPDMPSELTLWLQGKVRRFCKTAWRSAGEVGVQFLKRPNLCV